MLSAWDGSVADTVLVFIIDLLCEQKQLKETTRELLQQRQNLHLFCQKNMENLKKIDKKPMFQVDLNRCVTHLSHNIKQILI